MAINIVAEDVTSLEIVDAHVQFLKQHEHHLVVSAGNKSYYKLWRCTGCNGVLRVYRHYGAGTYSAFAEFESPATRCPGRQQHLMGYQT